MYGREEHSEIVTSQVHIKRNNGIAEYVAAKAVKQD